MQESGKLGAGGFLETVICLQTHTQRPHTHLLIPLGLLFQLFRETAQKLRENRLYFKLLNYPLKQRILFFFSPFPLFQRKRDIENRTSVTHWRWILIHQTSVHMTAEAAEEVKGTIVCLGSQQIATAAHTHLALRLIQGIGCLWKCLLMNPSSWMRFIRRRSPVAQLSAVEAQALIVAAKTKQMTPKMVSEGINVAFLCAAIKFKEKYS